MIVATAFGLLLMIFLIVADWYQFTSLREFSIQYGCRVARRQERVASGRIPFAKHFDPQGFLPLPHGIARFIQDQQVIVIRPSYQLFAMRFRTAWPLKGTITVESLGHDLSFILVKRMPWSSALLTMVWLGIVVMGTLGFIIAFAMDGGFGSAGGVLMGLGVVGLGVLVLAFGLILISLAYRLEDHRLMQVYQELQHVLSTEDAARQP